MANLSDEAARAVSEEMNRNAIAIRNTSNQNAIAVRNTSDDAARSVAEDQNAAIAKMKLGVNQFGRVTEPTLAVSIPEGGIIFPTAMGGGGGGVGGGGTGMPSSGLSSAELGKFSDDKNMALISLLSVAIVAVAAHDGKSAYQELHSLLNSIGTLA